MQAVDGKKVLLDYLKGNVSEPVFPKRPDGELPNSFVVVIDAGGQGRVDRLSVQAGFIVDTYAKTDGLARQLAARVDELIHAMPQADVPICAVNGNLPRENPDIDAPSHQRRSNTYILTSLLKGQVQ